MSRRLPILAVALVALHVGAIVTLGNSPAGSLLSNLLETAAGTLAAVMAYGAFRRASGMSRPFWLLVGCGMGVWGVANLGCTYYEVVLRAEAPPLSFVRFLFDTQGAFFAMALFLDEDKDASQLHVSAVFDFLQIAIIFYFVYVRLYYVPSLALDPHSALLREWKVIIGEDVVILSLCLMRLGLARSKAARKLYGGMALYLGVYYSCAAVAQHLQTARGTPGGTLLDLAWTLPLLWGAVWAWNWKPETETWTAARLRPKSLGGMILTNATFALAPVAVLFLSAGLGPEWRAPRFILVGVSILCYAARMGASDYRQSQSAELVRQQTNAMDSAMDGMAILDADAKFLYANSGYARMTGYENPREIIGRPWREVFDPGDAQRYFQEIRKGLQEQGKWFGQVMLHLRGGGRLPLEMAITALPQGGVVCVSRDLTDRRKAEVAREEAESKFRMIVERVAAIAYIAEIGMNGRWYYVSPQIESILGYTPDEWIENSESWIRFVHPEDHATVQEAEEACLKGRHFQAEYRIMHKDGRTTWVNDSAVVVQGSENHPLMEGIIVDITEKKLMEGQLQQSRRMEAIGRLAGGIAHDFNNLLTIIKGYTELARQRAQGHPQLWADIERIDDASERAAALVRQLLAFSRKQVLQPKNLDLNGTVLGLEKLLRRLIGEDVEMRTMVAKDLGTIKADPVQLEQVLMNLVVNARDALPTGGRLTVETANVDLDAAYASEHASVKPGRYVMLAVSDSGVGMSPETIAHIFEPFFTTKGGTRGTGLGLATVYGIVKQSGGYIWVYSEPGKGSTFKVYFPRVAEAADSAAPEPAEMPARSGAETILLVEDDEAVRELAHMILTAQGYEVIAAETPARAEEISRQRPGEIHLVLTDVIMPAMSGRELVRRLVEGHPRMRVLYMSGYTDNVIAQGGVLEAGISFLQKPFTPRGLAQKVREVLDAPVAAR